MEFSENLKKRYKEAVEGCDLSVYADMVDLYAVDKDIAGKIKEHAEKAAETLAAVQEEEAYFAEVDRMRTEYIKGKLRCPVCDSGLVAEDRPGIYYCGGCGNKFGVYDRLRAELERKIPDIPDSNVLRHSGICDELNELYARKNRDYGDSYHLTYLEEGMAMARIRLTDKLQRFKKLTRDGGQLVNDESVRDTLIDMANYCIMTAMEMDRERENDRER